MNTGVEDYRMKQQRLNPALKNLAGLLVTRKAYGPMGKEMPSKNGNLKQCLARSYNLHEVTFMRRLVVLMGSLVLTVVLWSAFALSSSKSDHLFFIERSKNRKIVQYDVRLTESDNIYDSDPFLVYWILENGTRRDLTQLQRSVAYGIDTYKKLGENKFRVFFVALKEREVIVEKSEGSFRAITDINGKPSILERVYVESRERWIGLPKVVYIDFFGRNKETGSPVSERMVSK